MTALLSLSALIAWLIGLALLRLLWPGAVPFTPGRLVAAALGLGLGTAVSAVLLFAWLVIVGPSRMGYIASEVAALAILGALAWRRHLRTPSAPSARDVDPEFPAVRRALRPAVAATVVCALGGFIALSVTQPHGGWDAWMDWNLRARLIFRGGTDWRDAFSGLIPWSHPDYPLVVQGSVVRAWTYAGGERLAGSAMVALVFTAATVALAGAALALFRSRGQAALAALVLLGTPFFIAHGASQFADVPVGFFFLATVILLSLHHRHAVRTLRFAGLAGFACGLAMWTKNEGLLFLVSVVAAQTVAGIGKGRGGAVARQLLAFGAGLLLPAMLLVYFKIRFAPPNDLISTVGAGQTLAWLLDPRRHAIALLAFGKHILGFGDNGLVSGVWLLVTYMLCVGVRVPSEDRRWAATVLLAIAAMLAGHFLVFVGTTPDVARLLNSSLDRLLLQLWPSAVFLFFMLVPVPEAMVETAPRATA